MTAAPSTPCELCGHPRSEHGNDTAPTSECHADGCTCAAFVWRNVASTWSVLRARLQAAGDEHAMALIGKLAPEADAYRCPRCGAPDPVVALAEPAERLVMVCSRCNREAFERGGFEVPS